MNEMILFVISKTIEAVMKLSIESKLILESDEFDEVSFVESFTLNN